MLIARLTDCAMNAAHSDASYTMMTHNYHYALNESEINMKTRDEYYDSPELATQAVDVPDYSNSQHYRRLVANAQTGKLLDPRSKGPNRSDAPEIIMWKDTP